MKKFKRIRANQKLNQKLLKRCPLGGICLNPMCMFGCIEY